jgi:protein-tyrosine phosphatase
LRDIGGYTTTHGQTIRWQRVYRGASLAFLSPEDGQKLVEMGIKLVCDFRSEEEAATDPDILPDKTMQYLALPARSNDDTRWRRLRILLFERNRLGDTLVDMYTRIMIDNNAALFGKLFERIADEKNLPLLVHCAAGKDRTGIAMALLLRYLGVPESTVVADYTLSNLYFEYFRKITAPVIQRVAKLGISEAEMQPLLVAHPNTLQTMLAYVDAKYGSVEKYLREKVGLSDTTLAQVRANMLEK